MPIVDAREGGELDRAITDLLDAPNGQQEQLLRRVLVERLDFEPTSGTVPILSGRVTDLPEIAARIASLGGIQVLLVTLAGPRITATTARAIIKALTNQVGEHLLVARTEDGALFHLIYPRWVGSRTVLKRIVLERGRPRRTAVGCLAVLYQDRADNGVDARTAIEHAFDVEAVTREFYKGYEALFRDIESEFAEQSGDGNWAHDYALQLLNRVMFLYFIDRKGWLEPEFLKRFWQAYRQSGQPSDTFFGKWLKVLFFEAFNNRFSHPSYLPAEICDTLQNAPWLNGGLFERNDLDEAFDPKVSDELWRRIMGFFDSYNFTVAESTPWDQEVAVDPAMIGKVYESLVNVSEVDERGEAGIFYTPRTEIDLMCRLALVDYLANHLGEARKSLLYNVVFAVEPEEKEEADRLLRDENLWPEFDSLIQDITVVDPACGSGSFLVGMLQVLDDLLVRADRELGRQETAYERKTRIIGQSLYGVDVMEWAVDVAELRLWLQLVIDTEITWEERKLRPLLPNLAFKIRCGDSLVQEVAGVNMSRTQGRMELTAQVRGQLTKLKGEKLRYYSNEEGHLSQEELEGRELELFRAILNHRVDTLDRQIRENQGKLDAARIEQGQLPGMVRERGRQTSLEEIRLQEKITRLESDLAQAKRARGALVSAKDVPFVWDIAFVEVFEGEGRGFDIVVGNPPYVERHKIRDPSLALEIGQPGRKAYLAKLAKSVYEAFPRYFGLGVSGRTARSISAMCDLYIYFYFHGLSLLNSKGSFCFITSNSWLDVGYGADLQEFLLKHCHVKMVLDNQERRVFASADINTVIALLSAPDDTWECGLGRTARFVMFKVSHEEILSPVIFQEIEEASGRKETPEFRIHSVSQDVLLEDGSDVPAQEGGHHGTGGSEELGARFPTALGRYVGNKWGGKYLRAPDIYHVIREKGMLVPVSRYATARLGVTTGANEFFFIRKLAPGRYVTGLDGEETEIAFPDKFARPVIRTVSECTDVSFRESHTPWRIVALPDDVSDPEALAYIELGETVGISERPFFRNKRHWFSLSFLPTDTIAVPEIVFARYFFLWNEDGCVLNKNFYGFLPRKLDSSLLWGLLNCSYSFLQFELSSRKPGAGASGIGVGVANRALVLSLELVGTTEQQAIRHAGEELRNAPIREAWDDLASRERRRLDAIIFDAIGLTQAEQDAVSEAVISLVVARMKKAKSLSGVA